MIKFMFSIWIIIIITTLKQLDQSDCWSVHDKSYPVDMKNEDSWPNYLGPLGLTLIGRAIVNLNNFV